MSEPLTVFEEAELLGRLSRERQRSEFRGKVLETFLLYLFTYQLPIDSVRQFLDKVETQSLRGFPDLSHAGWRAQAAGELLERLWRLEASTIEQRVGRSVIVGQLIEEKKESSE